MTGQDRLDPIAAPEGGIARHWLRPFVLSSALSVALFSLSAIILYATVRTPGLQERTDLLATYTFLVVLGWIVGTVFLLRGSPESERLVGTWKRNASILICCLHIAVVALIWAILPKLDQTRQFYVIIFVMAYVPAQIVSSPESVWPNRIGIVTVLGSLALFLATRGNAVDGRLALYIAGFAGLMFVLGDRIYRTVEAIEHARAGSARDARKLARLVEIVSAERDAKTRFIAAASHDLGQPLQAMALFFDQALLAPDTRQRDTAIVGVRRALAATEQMLSHMLHHLRLEADEIEPQLAFADVRELLNRVRDQYAAMARNEELAIIARAPSMQIALDGVLVQRALGNLVQNAIDHSRGTRLLLIVRVVSDDRLRFWALDNGVGVNAAEASLIFDDYFRGTSSDHSRPKGFGLGLASVKRSAKAMDGDAGVDLRWRGGAFWIELPLVARDARHRSSRNANP